MRRALGLSIGSAASVPQQRPEQARQRHKFVQDGGVPVVMLNHKPEPETAALRERISALEHALEQERTAHGGTRKMLSEQQAAAQALQTRLAHAALAHSEALETERRQREAAQQALAALHAAPAGRARRVRPVVEAESDAVPVEAEADGDTTTTATVAEDAGAPAVVAAAAPKAKRGRPRINPVPEPKPLRWWTPSFKARSKA